MFARNAMMTKQAIFIALLFLVLPFTKFVAQVESFMDSPCEEPLSSYKGVPARSNEGYPYGSCGGTSVYGLKYQCVEYVRRFYHVVKGIDTRDDRWEGNASTFFETAEDKGLSAFENGGTMPPRPDDIITFQGGMYGHVAVITAVTDEYIEFIEQNLSESGVGRLPYEAATHQVANRDVPGGKLILEGWLRPQSG
ncbi:MAG: CHAP domain-containing protein, partial [Nitrospiria bacterium]